MASNKILVITIATCLHAITGVLAPNPCVADCVDRPSGDYQSCNGCNVYATCSNGLLYDDRPCPAGLVWDDNRKRCETTSPTCTDTDTSCVSSCDTLSDGDYQSCNSCNVYLTCSNGIPYDNRACPASLEFDDNSKRCEYKSTTCNL